jgi:hypothetical protein
MVGFILRWLCGHESSFLISFLSFVLHYGAFKAWSLGFGFRMCLARALLYYGCTDSRFFGADLLWSSGRSQKWRVRTAECTPMQSYSALCPFMC